MSLPEIKHYSRNINFLNGTYAVNILIRVVEFRPPCSNPGIGQRLDTPTLIQKTLILHLPGHPLNLKTG